MEVLRETPGHRLSPIARLLLRPVVWPEGSVPSRVARGVAVILVLILSICTQTASILRFPGTNDYYGMVAWHGIAAYSLIEDHTLTHRSGGLAAINGFVQRSAILKQDYVELADVLPALRQTKPGDVLFYYPPGYSVFLAGTYIASHQYRYTTARTIQQLLNMIGVPLLLLLSGSLLGCFSTGYAAAALYGLFAGTAQQVFYILPDALMPFMATLLLATSAWCVRRDRLAGYAVLGVVLGVAANFRSDALGIGVFLAFGIWRSRGKLNLATLTRIAIVAAVTFVLLIPFGLIQKNFKPIGRFQITSPGMGQNLWEAYGETPNPHGATVSDAAVDQMLQKAGYHIHLPDGEAYLKRLWLQAALRDPGWFLWSIRHRFITVLGHWQLASRSPFVPWNGESSIQRFLTRGTNRILAWLAVGLFACGVVGVFSGRLGLLIAAAPLSYCVFFSVLHLEARYVIPALGPLAFLGCYGATVLGIRLHDAVWKSA
jgi:hypothetical protein